MKLKFCFHLTYSKYLLLIEKKCVFCSGLVGLDGLDAANYTGVAPERRSGVGGSDPAFGVWRACDQTTFWILCLVLETPQAG